MIGTIDHTPPYGGRQLRHLAKLLVLLVIVALAACGSPLVPPSGGPPLPSDPEPLLEQEMALNLPATYPDVSHVRVVLYDEAGSAVATSGTVETLGEGLYGGPISAVRADGSASIVMPDVADLPPAVFTPPAGINTNIDSATCEPNVSDPTVTVTKTSLLLIIGLPNVFIRSGGGWAASLTASALVDPDGSELDIESAKMISWVHADGDVKISTVEAGCVGSLLLSYHLDLDLVEGWNQVAYSFELTGEDLTDVTLRNSNFASVFVTPLGDPPSP